MLLSRIAVVVLGGAMLASVAQAKSDKPASAEARIPFASSEGILDFRADGNEALWIQGTNGKWYRAELLGYCRGLDYALAIGVDTRGTSALDKFGQIVVEGRRCPIRSLTASAPPPTKAKKAKKADDAT